MKKTKKKLKIVIIVFTILVFSIGFFFYHNNPETAEATWWNDSWSYRQSIQVTNNISAENNVYISVTLDTDTASTSMQADCGDFRFTRENGEILSYYIISGCRTTTNVIHIKFSIFEAGEQAIYFYYGNASVENGFNSSDFATEASNYVIGAVSAEEVGPGSMDYWSFDEGYGTTVHDESGQGNDGTISGAVWKNEEECVSGKCLWFDGEDSTKIDADIQDNLEKMTVCLWIKPNSLINTDGDSETILIDKGWQLGYYNDGKLEFLVRTDGAYPQVYSSENIFENKWYYICGVLNGVGSNPNIYINGLDKSNDAATGSGSLDDAAFLLRIGATSNEWWGNFEGYIDEVKIYPYVRTANQILQDYNAGLSGVKSNSGVSVAFGGSSDKWLSDGLVGYWKMDETATTSGAVDASGNGNDGTYYGNASTTGGKFGNGGVFSGTSTGYIEVADDDSLDVVDSITLSAWIKTVHDGFNSIILDKKYHDCYTFRKKYDGTIRTALRIGGTVYDYEPGGTLIDDENWHHVVTTYDGSSIKSYVDGSLVGVPEEAFGTISATANNLIIGWASNLSGSDYYWQGNLDEVRIYNRALSKSEVRKLYEWAPGPVLHLKMDEMSGTSTYDVSGNENHGNFVSDASSPSWARGRYGGGLDFDGVDDYVLLPSTARPIRNFTVSMWFKTDIEPNAYSPSHPSLIGGTGIGLPDEQGGFSLTWSSNNNTLYSDVYNSTTNSDNSYGLSSWKNDWHFVVATRDSITQELWIDGIKRDSDSTVVGDIDWSGYPLFRIGYGYRAYFDGLIDDVRIYNYARTQKQILEDMNGGGPASKMPVLHLSFDEGYGETVHDSSIHKNNGTAYVGTGGSQTATSSMWEKSGKVNGAMEFDGTDDYVEVPYFLDPADGSFSASVWFKADTIGSSNDIIQQYDGSGSSGRSWIYVSSESEAISSYLGGDFRDSTVFPQINTWYHALFTYNSVSDDFIWYINGEQSGNYNFTMETCDGGMIFGESKTHGSEFDGIIDEVKIWNFALNEDEVKQEYNSGQATVMGGGDASANNNGTTVTGASTAYCIPGDTSKCSPPVLEFKMDEMSGTTTYDTSGSGNDGAITDASWVTVGKYSSALSFDGDDDYVRTNPTTDFDFPDAFTVSAWAKPDNFDSDRMIVYRNPDFYLTYNATAPGYWAFGIWDTTWDSAYSNSPPNGQWQYITGVRESDGTMYLYVDGIKQADTGFRTKAFTSGLALFVGVVSSGISDYSGLIDDVRIYNYARTPAQIAWDYNKGKPVARYKFDECSGGTIHDESGNGNHGTLNLGSSGVTATGTCASSSDSFWYNGEDGKKNESGSFDGTDDYVDLSQVDTFENATEFSIATWFYVYDINTGGTILSKWQDSPLSDRSVSLNIYNNGTGILWGSVHEDDSVGSNYVDYISDTGLIKNNIWYHLVMTFEAESSTGLRIYLNGEENTNSPLSTSDVSEIESNSVPVRIGSWYDNAYPFDGKIDDVQIFNYALTAEQVKNVYNDGAVSFK